MKYAIRILAVSPVILIPSSPLLANHAAFYKAVFRAIRENCLHEIKDLFCEAAWLVRYRCRTALTELSPFTGNIGGFPITLGSEPESRKDVKPVVESLLRRTFSIAYYGGGHRRAVNLAITEPADRLEQ